MSEPNRTNAAPGKGAASIQRLRLGDLELWILCDMTVVQDAGLFALEAGEQEVATVLQDRLLPGHQLRLSSCPILVNKNGDLILIDAGIGTHDPSNPGNLPQQLATIGIRPEEISAALITHLHADHIGGAFDSKTGQLLFPNAVFYIPEPEISFWENPDVSHLRKVSPELIEFTIRTAQRAIECLPIKTFSFGNALFPGIQPIALPGHTAGQAGYLLNATGEDKQFLIGGDSMHHSVLHVQHPEWTTNGDSHPYLVHETRLQLLNRLADRNILFRCYHFAPDENGYVKKDAEGRFRFELA